MRKPFTIEPTSFWLLSILALLYFTAFLGVHPLVTPDEGRYPDVARRMLLSNDWVVPLLNGVPFFHKPIMYYWLEMLSMQVFGINTWAIRLPSALTAFMGCIILYQTGKRLFDKKIARAAAIILATNPLYFAASQFADMNLEVAVWISAAILCFFVAERGNTAHPLLWCLLAWIFVSFAVLTKGLIGIVLPGLVIGLWILIFRQWRKIPSFYLFRGSIIFSLIAAPWFWFMEQRQPGFLHYFIVVQHFQRYTDGGAHFNNVQPWWFYMGVILVGSMPWTTNLWDMIKRFSVTRHFCDPQLLGLLIIWIATIVIFFSIPASKVMGYILPAMPAIALLIACDLQNNYLFSKYHKLIFTLFLLLSWTYVLFQATQSEAISPTIVRATIISTIVSIGGSTFFWLRHRETNNELVGIAILMALFNLSCLVVIPAFMHHDQVKISNIIAQHWTENDEIIFYDKYFYDIPIYVNIKKPVIVVTNWNSPLLTQHDGWSNELQSGRQIDSNSHRWLIQPEQLAAVVESVRIHSPKTLFIVAANRDCSDLAKRYQLASVAEDESTCLLVNSTKAVKFQ